MCEDLIYRLNNKTLTQLDDIHNILLGYQDLLGNLSPKIRELNQFRIFPKCWAYKKKLPTVRN